MPMAHAELRAQVCEANRQLAVGGLVTLTWGNVSGITADRAQVVIKPSGVAYAELRPEMMVVVDLQGKVLEGKLRPSSDTPTHLRLYQAFDCAGGITHTHSPAATAFAQARRALPCLGTTHADHFAGPVPVTRGLTPAEVEAAYEALTGQVIVDCFQSLDPAAIPAVLVAGHAPFCWGPSPAASLDNAIALEAVARMALSTLQLAPQVVPLEPHLVEKHYRRKHGPAAYYGQRKPSP